MGFYTVLCLILGAGVIACAGVAFPFWLVEWLIDKATEK